jgi:hypothetical protein
MGYQETGPGFWPRLTLAGMMIVAAIILVRARIEAKKGDRASSSPVSKAFVVMTGLLVCYILAIHVTGFLPASFLMLLGFIRLLGEKNTLIVFCTSFGLVATIYVVFAKIMLSPLPRGVSIFKELSYFLY